MLTIYITIVQKVVVTWQLGQHSYLTVNGKAWVVLIKSYISNLVHTTRFWNNLHQVRSILNDWKAK
jgi:hypothetical protein